MNKPTSQLDAYVKAREEALYEMLIEHPEVIAADRECTAQIDKIEQGHTDVKDFDELTERITHLRARENRISFNAGLEEGLRLGVSTMINQSKQETQKKFYRIEKQGIIKLLQGVQDLNKKDDELRKAGIKFDYLDEPIDVMYRTVLDAIGLDVSFEDENEWYLELQDNFMSKHLLTAEEFYEELTKRAAVKEAINLESNHTASQ